MILNRYLTLAATAALAAALPTAASAKPAGAFLADAIKGDASEMALGRLAQRNGESPGVRSFGMTLARDHARARVMAISAARQLRLPVPGRFELKPDALMAYNRLSRMHGRAFDRMFAQHMIGDHRADIAAFQAQARTGDPVTRDLARRTLPDLQKHLRLARALR